MSMTDLWLTGQFGQFLFLFQYKISALWQSLTLIFAAQHTLGKSRWQSNRTKDIWRLRFWTDLFSDRRFLGFVLICHRDGEAGVMEGWDTHAHSMATFFPKMTNKDRHACVEQEHKVAIWFFMQSSFVLCLRLATATRNWIFLYSWNSASCKGKTELPVATYRPVATSRQTGI